MSIWTLAGPRPFLRATRCFSSAGNVVRADAPNPVNLSPEKMRALIAMYHQAETFVTRENLDAKIDEAFTGELDRPKLEGETLLSLEALQKAMRRRKDAPTVAEWSSSSLGNWTTPGANTKELWSGRRENLREKRVMDALYGTETQGGKTLPGWDVLNEEGSMIEASVKEDQEKKYHDSDY
ncbi:hypothetical protein MSAN_01427100 [Mycena sanguinolenta]|uniref:Uncharacterized protein n=1 Tax=Mycena sanguinolenta TaxID=230812 RepID=A0A8H6YBN1_9AGAR|nr:hypothetical protein MSAN_01427100 [Mycena sanguinolenta]